MQNTINKLEKFYDILGEDKADKYFKEHCNLASTVSVLVYDFGWGITAQLLDDVSITPELAVDYLLENSDYDRVDGDWTGKFTDEFDGDYWIEKDIMGEVITHNIYLEEDYSCYA